MSYLYLPLLGCTTSPSRCRTQSPGVKGCLAFVAASLLHIAYLSFNGPNRPPLILRAGSGALATVHPTYSIQRQCNACSLRGSTGACHSQHHRVLQSVNSLDHDTFSPGARLFLIISWLVDISMFSIPCFMVNSNGNSRGTQTPLSWNPDVRRQSIRAWVADLQHWIIMTDTQPEQQIAAIISELRGTAREMARTISPDEMFTRGAVNGTQLDPVAYLVHGLSRSFGQLAEETRLAATTELWSFERRFGEPTDSPLARFELARTRARDEGNLNMFVEMDALQLMRALNISARNCIVYLRPCGGNFPNAEGDFAELQAQMR